MENILVIGASGVLGQLVCKELAEKEYTILVGDYKIARGQKIASMMPNAQFVEVDAREKKSVRLAIEEAHAVIVVVKQEHPFLQCACKDKGIPCVDVTVDKEIIEGVRSFDQEGSTSVLMAGFFPGLSGIVIKKAHHSFQEIDRINVGLLQSTNAKVGGTGISDMLQIINRKVEGKEGFSIKETMNFGEYGQSYTVRKIEHIERKMLQQENRIGSLNYFTSWESESFNRKIRFLQKIGLIHWLSSRKNFLEKMVKHHPERGEDAYLTVETISRESNHEWRISVRSDYEATAALAVLLMQKALKSPERGTCYPWELLSLEEVQDKIPTQKIRVVSNEK